MKKMKMHYRLIGNDIQFLNYGIKPSATSCNLIIKNPKEEKFVDVK